MNSQRWAGAAACVAVLGAALCAGCASSAETGAASESVSSGGAASSNSAASSGGAVSSSAAAPTGPAATTTGGPSSDAPSGTGSASGGSADSGPSAAPAAVGSEPVVRIDRTVGPLFRHGLAAGHSCTAGVVDSPAGDLVVTAAHCISGTGKGMLFAPGYLAGKAPYGTWTVRAVYAAVPWIERQDDQSDVAFLKVAPTSGSGPSVQAAVGGSQISDSTEPGQRVQVRGYVAGSDTPVTCTTTVYVDDGYPAFDCPGFAGGTSGSPWVAEPATRGAAPLVIGVIGGLREGGCTVGTSYSAWFTAGTLALFRQAVDGAAPSTLPAATSSC